MANQPVTFTATSGAVEFNACGAATCIVMTDASGSASTTVTALGPGNVSLSATSAYGSQSASFTAMTRIRTVTPVVAVQYVAADTTVLWTPQVSLGDNSAPIAGVRVNWQTISGAMTLSPAQSLADAQGIAETVATAGPLAAGGRATASACAWTTICASFAAEGVGPADWRLEIVSGAGQSVGAADTLAPVMLRVTDPAGHAVAGVVVQIHQTVDAWQMPCPDRGRCPVPPSYDSQVSSVRIGYRWTCSRCSNADPRCGGSYKYRCGNRGAGLCVAFLAETALNVHVENWDIEWMRERNKAEGIPFASK